MCKYCEDTGKGTKSLLEEVGFDYYDVYIVGNKLKIDLGTSIGNHLENEIIIENCPKCGRKL